MKKKLFKKAQFFSLTIFLIIVLVIIIFSMVARLKDNEERFNIERLKKSVINNFVIDFEQVYVEQIILTSLKPSVAEFLENDLLTNKNDLVRVMNGETVSGVQIDPSLTMISTLERAMGTITFAVKNRENPNMFVVTLDRVDQNTHDELEFTFLVSYVFEIDDGSWHKQNLEIKTTMDIYSLKHPNSLYQGKIIEKEYWERDTAATICFVDRVFDDADNCPGLYDMRPKIFVESVI